jgi:glutathione S-transferase
MNTNMSARHSHDPTQLASEQFVLRTTLTSPFGRKVRMAADVLGLAHRITIEPADVMDETDSLRSQNPLGKLPCLVRMDGTGIYDSGVILQFLQEVARTERLLPSSGPERVTMLVSMALADGIIDAGAIIIYEQRYHEPAARSEHYIAHHRGKIVRALATFEHAHPAATVTDAVSIGLACALGFLDKRKVIEWRAGCPRLVEWLEAFAAHEPAFQRTRAPLV